MLYNILTPYIDQSHVANLFHYITFRCALALIMSLIMMFSIGPRFIAQMRLWQKKGQPIREDGPLTHLAKSGTPTMGGLLMVSVISLTTLLLADLYNPYVWIILFVLISFSALGFTDDYLKVSKQNVKGVVGKIKMLIQLLVSLIAFKLIQNYGPEKYNTILSIPFFKNLTLDLEYIYLPFAAIVIIGSSNAVNLTDGLDGLVSIPIAISAGCFAIFAYLAGNKIFSDYLQIFYIPGAGDLSIICGAIVGSCLGFLWFNVQPAEIFMGDTGSLALGGTLGVMSLIIKHEIVLAIVGGLFVIEALSVIIQVYYFKFTGGKRFFQMSPIHHHFEKLGWPESKVVVRFWIIAILFALLG